MKKLIIAVALLLSTNVYSQNWIDFKDKTYVGGYYAAVCNVCIQGRYNDDSNGYWQCTDDREVTISPVYQKGCAKAVANAFFGKH